MSLDHSDSSEAPPPSERILIVGPGGSGKTFIVARLRAIGIGTFDADAVLGRLRDPSRTNPIGKTEVRRRLAIQGLDALYRRADELGFTMLDASLSPEAIFAQIGGADGRPERADPSSRRESGERPD